MKKSMYFSAFLAMLILPVCFALAFEITLPNRISRKTGKTLMLPLIFEGAPDFEISEFQIVIAFDPNVLRPLKNGYETRGCLTADWELDFKRTDGIVNVGGVSFNNAILPDACGRLLYLVFEVIGEYGAQTDLSVVSCSINDDDFPMSGGHFHVRLAPKIIEIPIVDGLPVLRIEGDEDYPITWMHDTTTHSVELALTSPERRLYRARIHDTRLDEFVYATLFAPSEAMVIAITEESNCNILCDSLLHDDPHLTIIGCNYDGCAHGSGVFVGGPMGINNGIILSSGEVLDALPPNDMGSMGESCGIFFFGHPLCDVLIDDFLIFSTDYSLLEITFTIPPGINSLRIDFIVGSEEYPEFVGDIFNDVFGIFVDGADLAHQIAFDPFDDIISINGTFFSSALVVEQPSGGGDLEWDGCTPLLTARVCLDTTLSQHNMSIIVGDASDHIYDTGVLLADLQGTATEHCGGTVCMIDVNAWANDSALCGTSTTLHADVTGAWGDAIYQWSSNPPGFSSTEQNPSTGVVTGGTWFIVTVLDSEFCEAVDSVFIADTCAECTIEVTASADDDTVCDTGTILHANVTGAIGPVSFSWTSNPSGFTSNVENPATGVITEDTWFYIQVSDSALCYALDSVLVIYYCPCVPAATWIICPLPCWSFTSCDNQFMIFGIQDTMGILIDTTRIWFTRIVNHPGGSADTTTVLPSSPDVFFSGLSDSISATVWGMYADGDSVVITFDSLYNSNDCITIP